MSFPNTARQRTDSDDSNPNTPLNGEEGRTTVSKKHRFSSILVAALVATFTTGAYAADRDKKKDDDKPAVTAEVKADADGVEGEVKTPEKAEPTKPERVTAYYPVTSWLQYALMADTWESWYRNETQKKWSTVTVKESAESTLEEDADKVDVLLEQIIAVLKNTGPTTPGDTKAAFTKWMKDNGCEYLRDKKIGEPPNQFTISEYSEGCEPLFKSLVDEFEARKAKATPGDRLDNAVHTLKAAEKYKGTHRVNMAHKAMGILILALPESERPWPLTDAALMTFFEGEQSCVFKKDDSKTCGTITGVGPNGLTLDGKEIAGGDIRSLCFGTEEECEDMVGSGGDTSGLLIRPAIGISHMAMEGDVTNPHLFKAKLSIGYKFDGVPLTVSGDVGAYNVFGGGQAPHYTWHETGEARWAATFGASVGFHPRWDWIGLSLLASGYASYSGEAGGGFDLEAGPQWYFGSDSDQSVTTALTGGYMDMGKPLGGNPTSLQEDPRLQGPTIGVSVSGNFTIF